MHVVHFTPGSALLGGALIGLAAAIVWWSLGRIAGVSGIASAAVLEPGAERGWRVAFLAGLLAVGVGAMAFAPQLVHFVRQGDAMQLTVAGLLVGFGTQLSGGCTSGHGVCGIGRFSVRSIVATLCFMAAGIVTVTIMGRLL